MKLIILFLSLSTLFLNSVQAQVVSWEGGEDFVDIGNRVYLLEDAEGTFSFEEVSSAEFEGKFTPSDQLILNLGFTESVYWLHFTFDHQMDEELIFEIAHAFLPVSDLYYRDSGGRVNVIPAGYNIPLNDKTVKHHFQIYPLPKGKHEFYVRLISNSHPLKLRIYKESAYEVKTYKQLLVYGFYLGFMAFVILSNLFFYATLKSRLYLFYAGIVVVYISYASAVMDGFILYFFPEADLMFWYLTIPAIGVPLQLWYANVFLDVKSYSPKLSRITNGLIIYFFAYFLLRLAMPLTLVLAVNTVHALISFFAMGYLGYATGKKGNKLGYYFALAYFIYFVLVLTEATYIQIGKPGYFFELSHVALATLIEAFLLSFLLSKKFEFEKKDSEKKKEEAQQQLFEKIKENEKIVKEQNVILESKVEERTLELNETIQNLTQTQAKLIQSEKMASLGELTAGIAHEIQNPLNFVNNFSDVSIELLDEMHEELKMGNVEEADTISEDLKENLRKISHHGLRASGIIQSMLAHSRSTKANDKRSTNLNTLVDEYIRLAYHGMRAKDKSFDVSIQSELDPDLPEVLVVPQDIGRVLLNLLNNAFQACAKSVLDDASKYSSSRPEVKVSTKKYDDTIKIMVQDNGTGIPDDIKDKIFQPFFTTKPTGQGTGLGLSLSYDIIKAHDGEVTVVSEKNVGTTFHVSIPIK